MTGVTQNDTMRAGTVAITGYEGAELAAYLARPLGDGPRGGVVGWKKIFEFFGRHLGA
jgi:dienelactone hydrolase